ncbi:MAG: GNAT family N-acetyltransferase [Peptococcaceae bacterium]|nr:GNAT family N-acetyltransferase [Peptococcaceae bacterium]
MIREASETDIRETARIYEEVLDQEDRRGTSYTNWQRGKYPTDRDAQKAFDAGTLYTGEEKGQIFGSVILNHLQPPEYGNISWTIPGEGKDVLVIHTLVISPSWAGRGKGKEFVAFAEAKARELGCTAIRLDTYEGNIPAAAMYEKLGYRYAGSTLFHFQQVIWENLKCYEKKIGV